MSGPGLICRRDRSPGGRLSGNRWESVLQAEAAVPGYFIALRYTMLLTMHLVVHKLTEVSSRGDIGGSRSNQRATLDSRFSSC
jgi:hypothetical protein